VACDLCDELAGRGAPEQVRAAGGRQIHWISRSFAMLPSLGPVSSIHLLLVPRTHQTLALANGGVDDVAPVIARWRAYHRNSVVFEHGNAASGCGVHHAHVHLVTLGLPASAHQLFPDLDLAKHTALKTIADEQQETFWCIAGDGDVWACHQSGLRSQYARHRVAIHNRVPFCSDWRQHNHVPWFQTGVAAARDWATESRS